MPLQRSKPVQDFRAEMDERVAAAIANGTHSAGPKPVVCQQCGKWAPAYLHKTFDGAMVGECCTPAAEIKRIGMLASAARERQRGSAR